MTCAEGVGRSCLMNNVNTSSHIHSFYQYWIFKTFGSGNISVTNATRWLQGNVTAVSAYLFQNSTFVSYNTFVTRIIELINILYPVNPICSTLRSEGCPCIPMNITSFSCQAGLRCAIDNRWTIAGLYINPLFTLFKSICVKCDIGTYCPQGTFETGSLLCPEGSYCPTPSSKHPCDAGNFCPKGSVSPLPCDMASLLKTTLSFRSQDVIVIDRLVSLQEAFTGNLCPVQSATPFYKCPEGRFCPNTSVDLPCPKGYFCRSQSMAPTPCPYLSSCPALSNVPRFIGIPYLFIGMLAVSSMTFMIIFMWMNHRRKKSNSVLLNVPAPPKDPPYPHQWSIQTTTSQTLEKIALYDVSASVSARTDPWLWPNSVIFNPCKLNAIIGGSGCGKSTFLDLLRGSLPNGVLTGSVEIAMKNQTPWILRLSDMDPMIYEKFTTIRGYVPQDDIVYGDLTVKENLFYSSLIKKKHSFDTALEITDRIISQLGLTFVRDKIVGTVESRGISGGQRKRVNIGMELVHMPLLLIMDEPTSGLDATGCQNLIEVCHALCVETGITIIAVIHQPRYTSFVLFDHIILLCKYGTVYEGSPISSLVYFSQGLDILFDKNENPADVLMDIISGNCGFKQEELVSIWRTKGAKWLEKCHDTYPLLPMILQESIVFDSPTQTYFREQLFNQTLSPKFITTFFQQHGIPMHEKTALDFIEDRCIKTMDDLVKYMHTLCSRAVCRNDFGNIIERLTLLQDAPSGIYKRFTEYQLIRHITLAYKFIKILLRRIKKDHLIVHNRIKVGLENEFLLLSMTFKAVVKQNSLKTNACEDVNVWCIDHQTAPPWWFQTWIICMRKGLSLWRSPWPIQLIIPLAASFIVGTIQGPDFIIGAYPNNIAYAMVTMGVLSIITHMRTFSLDKVVIKRETDSKVSILPYFIAYGFVDLTWIVLIPLLFVVPYYYFTLPRTPFITMFGVAVAICWWCSGAAYIMSSLPIGLQWTNLFGVFVGIIFGAFLQGLNPTIASSRGKLQEVFLHGSYNRWAMEILSLTEFSFHEKTNPNVIWPIMNRIGLCGLNNPKDDNNGLVFWNLYQNHDVLTYCREYIRNAYLWLFAYGTAFRLLALIGLWWFNYPLTSHWFTKLKGFMCVFSLS